MALCRLNSPSNLKLSSAKDRAGRGLGAARRRWDGHSCSAHTHLPSWGSLLPGPFCLDMTYAALFSQHFSGNCFAAGSPCCYSKAQGWEASSARCYQEESRARSKQQLCREPEPEVLEHLLVGLGGNPLPSLCVSPTCPSQGGWICSGAAAPQEHPARWLLKQSCTGGAWGCSQPHTLTRTNQPHRKQITSEAHCAFLKLYNKSYPPTPHLLLFTPRCSGSLHYSGLSSVTARPGGLPRSQQGQSPGQRPAAPQKCSGLSFPSPTPMCSPSQGSAGQQLQSLHFQAAAHHTEQEAAGSFPPSFALWGPFS